MRLMFTGPRERVYGYRFLWTKRVTGFNHLEHCAKCLRGTYLRHEGYFAATGKWIDVDHADDVKAIYVCGVSLKGYAHNLHAPLVPDPGADPIHVEMTDGQALIIEHAKMLRIPPLPDRWGGLPKSFTSCRNFQFAVSLFGYPSKGRSLLNGDGDAD